MAGLDVPEQNPAAQRVARLRRRAQRRSIADGLFVVVATIIAGSLGENVHGMLLWGVAALSVGILAYMIRRGGDAVAIARADDWRAEAIAGRGISVAEWQGGKPLPAWDSRRGNPAVLPLPGDESALEA